MRVSVETTSGLERRLTVGVPADRIDTAVDKRLQEAARERQVAWLSAGQGAHAGDEAALWGRGASRSAGRGHQSVLPGGSSVRETCDLPASPVSKHARWTRVRMSSTPRRLRSFPAVEVNSLEDLAIEKPVAKSATQILTTLWKYSASSRGSWFPLSVPR